MWPPASSPTLLQQYMKQALVWEFRDAHQSVVHESYYASPFEDEVLVYLKDNFKWMTAMPLVSCVDKFRTIMHRAIRVYVVLCSGVHSCSQPAWLPAAHLERLFVRTYLLERDVCELGRQRLQLIACTPSFVSHVSFALIEPSISSHRNCHQGPGR